MRTVYEDVPLVPQSTNMSCWAASIAMIVGWKQGRCSHDGTAIAVAGGAKYAASMAKGLNPDDRPILSANGFAIEEPTCYAPAEVEQLLRLFGPLWVASAAPAPHVRVICGCAADHVYVNDPAPIGQGSQYTRRFNDFFGRVERLGASEWRQRAPVYLAHLR